MSENNCVLTKSFRAACIAAPVALLTSWVDENVWGKLSRNCIIIWT